MGKVTVKKTGRAELFARARKADIVLRDGSEAGVEETAEAVKGRARRNAPVDTGLLHESIESHTEGLEGEVGVYGEAAEYAPYPHFGTSKQEAQPFMLTAVEEERTTLTRKVAAKIREKLR